jgi:hypothetical protein
MTNLSISRDYFENPNIKLSKSKYCFQFPKTNLSKSNFITLNEKKKSFTWFAFKCLVAKFDGFSWHSFHNQIYSIIIMLAIEIVQSQFQLLEF